MNPLTQISIIRLEGNLAKFYGAAEGDFKLSLFSPSTTAEIVTGTAAETLMKLDAILFSWPNISISTPAAHHTGNEE